MCVLAWNESYSPHLSKFIHLPIGGTHQVTLLILLLKTLLNVLSIERICVSHGVIKCLIT